MIKYWIIIGLIILLGCADKKPKEELKGSVTKMEHQIKSEMEIKRDRMEIASIGNLAPEGYILDIDSIQNTTKYFEGKLLIIDFWATWCSPCIDEAPKFKELEKKYENEKIEFITVSVDDEYNYWKDYIIENSWQTDNYWFGMKESNQFFSYMYSEVEIDSTKTILIVLPKYVIISPKGKILNNQASKPSDPKFEEELKQLIKKHAT
jgi:thiol-disulfide isomerase/thioredoxin